MIDYSLYVITAEVKEKRRSHLDVARAALEGGATVIQFREKNYSTRQLFQVALKLRDLTADYGKPLIVNDRVDIALAVEADGVHLGCEDLPFEVVNKFNDELKVIGLSVRSLKEAKDFNRFGCSYFGAGPIFPTLSKTDASVPFGLFELKKIVALSSKPVVGIGGINQNNVEEVLKCGVAGIALISAIAYAEDMVKATAFFKEKIDFFKNFFMETKNELD